MSNTLNIPSVDLSDFLSGDPARKQKFVAELGKAYEEIGFVAIKGHFLTNQMAEELSTQTKKFFDLPQDTKRKYEIPELAGQRGYISFGKEHAKGRNEGDLKEFWHFGQIVDDNQTLQDEYAQNIFCDELPAFNQIGIETYKALENTGREMLKALAIYLNLDQNYFEEKVINGNSILRPIHYPPITDEPKTAVRAAEHEDISLITLLMGASADGLEVLNKQGEWIAVTALPDQLVVNVGDMLQRLTNNRLKSTTHRVVNPPKALWNTPRYSFPFFMHPQSSMKLDVLQTCIDAQHPQVYSPITAGDYLNERLREIGLKK